jgi:hypothetical protein
MKAIPDRNKFESNPAYNAWIDAQFTESNSGGLSILGKALRPSEVLHRLGYDVYESAFQQFKQSREESLIDLVTEQFPIIIAHPFSRFLEASENEIQRLQFLRDTWEGLINFVHAVIVGEARNAKLQMLAPARCSNILSDRLADRISTIESVLLIARKAQVILEASKIIDPATIAVIRVLNQARNAFSHTGAPSEGQAKQYIAECIDEVFDVLEAFTCLKDVRLLRYDRLDGTQLRHERFDGHSRTRRFSSVHIPPALAAASVTLLTREETLVLAGGKLLSVKPLLHLIPHPGGHFTQVTFFKKAKGAPPDRKLVFEIVGESVEVEEARQPFQPIVNDIRALFGEPPE